MIAFTSATVIGGTKLSIDTLKPAFNKMTESIKEKIRESDVNEALLDLSKKIENVIQVKTIDKIDESINLYDFYVPTDIITKDSSRQQINKLADISAESIVLEGTVGQGKSIFMRFLTHREALERSRIPIFYELRRLGEKQTIEDAVKTTFENWIPIFRDKDFSRFAESGNLVILLDGFDEIPQARVKDIINEIESWCERYPKLQLVISSRPEADIQKSTYFKIYKLASYDIDKQFLQIDKLVKDQEIRNSLRKSIQESNHEIKELLKTPLMVNLYVMKYRSKLEVPKTQSEFYEDLFNLLISKHDKSKIGYRREFSSNLNEIQLQDVFEEFCFMTGNKEQVSFGRGEAIAFIDKSIKNLNFNASPNQVLDDFSKVVCLLQNDGTGYSFIHKSIQEYYYACYISKKSVLVKERFYAKLKDDSFLNTKKNSLNFLESLDKYYFYKYFLVNLINLVIDEFQITPERNNLNERVFIEKYKDEQHGLLFINLICNIEIDLWFDNFLQPVKNLIVGLFNFDESVRGFQYLPSIPPNDSIKEFVRIDYFFTNSVKFMEIEDYFSKFSIEMLGLQKEVNEYINRVESIDFE